MAFQLRTFAQKVERIAALDQPADAIANAVEPIVSRRPLKDLLSGTFVGHPLHPILTDVPIGCWVSAAMLDVLGGRERRLAADRLIGLGVLAALPTAAAGLSDWVDVEGKERRVGLVHAAGNVTALLLYALSWVARKRGRRGRGVFLSLLGAGTAMGSAFLGGHLSFGMGVGVNQTSFEGDYYEEQPGDWRPALDASALDTLKPGKAAGGCVDGIDVLIYRDADRILAISDRCSHRGCALHTGRVRDGVVTCPCHQSQFSVEDGSVVRGPATSPQRAFDARIQDGKVEVRARR